MFMLVCSSCNNILVMTICSWGKVLKLRKSIYRNEKIFDSSARKVVLERVCFYLQWECGLQKQRRENGRQCTYIFY